MDIKRLLLIIIIIFSAIIVNAQQVTNVKSFQTGNAITIEYTLTGAKFNQKFNVSLYLSLDGGKTFQGPLSAVSGDVGDDVKAGTHKIFWDPYKDVNSLEGDVIFTVKAEVIQERVRRNFFVHYSGNYSLRNAGYTSPLGLSIGQIGKMGWYLSARMNSSAFKKAQYEYDGVKIVDYNEILYYEYDNLYQYPSFEAIGGITAQLNWNLFLYFGAGYGYQKYFAHINEFDYISNDLVRESYVNYQGHSSSGVVAEAGLIIKAKSLSFSAGYSTLAFTYSGIVFSIGFNI
jgi:hypothetical protein